MEDLLLILKFCAGSRKALQRIYEKYVNELLTLASSLLGDINSAHDVVQEVFVSFAQSAGKLKPQGSLRSFLITCMINNIRNRMKSERRTIVRLQEYSETKNSSQSDPIKELIASEQANLVVSAMAELPYEQRETVMLRLRAEMSFKEIARVQDVSINTIQSRYRYGMEKLRSLLNSEVQQ
jgi:RNA polymerase sigma-70 factor (ECF subfamily)